MWCHVVLVIHFWVLDWTTMMFHDTVSTLMYHFTFGMTTWWWYISMLSPYLCSNVFIWCYCCFKCLKSWKTWMYFVFFNVCRLFPIFPDFFADVFEKLYTGSLPTFSTLLGTSDKGNLLTNLIPSKWIDTFSTIFDLSSHNFLYQRFGSEIALGDLHRATSKIDLF